MRKSATTAVDCEEVEVEGEGEVPHADTDMNIITDSNSDRLIDFDDASCNDHGHEGEVKFIRESNHINFVNLYDEDIDDIDANEDIDKYLNVNDEEDRHRHRHSYEYEHENENDDTDLVEEYSNDMDHGNEIDEYIQNELDRQIRQQLDDQMEKYTYQMDVEIDQQLRNYNSERYLRSQQEGGTQILQQLGDTMDDGILETQFLSTFRHFTKENVDIDIQDADDSSNVHQLLSRMKLTPFHDVVDANENGELHKDGEGVLLGVGVGVATPVTVQDIDNTIRNIVQQLKTNDNASEKDMDIISSTTNTDTDTDTISVTNTHASPDKDVPSAESTSSISSKLNTSNKGDDDDDDDDDGNDATQDRDRDQHLLTNLNDPIAFWSSWSEKQALCQQGGEMHEGCSCFEGMGSVM